MTAPLLTHSVIIPTLNEAHALSELLPQFGRQLGCDRFEIIIADGGSTDGTVEVAHALAAEHGLNLKATISPPGRGRQMNLAVKQSSTPQLVFLHADSVLGDDKLLTRAANAFTRARLNVGTHRIAGHFAIRFMAEPEKNNAAFYYFYECKSHLNRPDTINGDQGFWLLRAYFDELGGFETRLAYMEDARLARRIFATGSWVLLPGVLNTSARRFMREGLRERQTLNMLLRFFDHIDEEDFFDEAASAYRQQAQTALLNLRPFLLLALKVSFRGPFWQWLVVWYRAGRYASENAWQIALALDCRRKRRLGFPPGMGRNRWLRRHDRYVAPLLQTPPGYILAGLLMLGWLLASVAVSSIKMQAIKKGG